MDCDDREARDVLDRIWRIVEFHGGVPEEMIEEIDRVLSVYREEKKKKKKGE